MCILKNNSRLKTSDALKLKCKKVLCTLVKNDLATFLLVTIYIMLMNTDDMHNVVMYTQITFYTGLCCFP